MRGSGSKPGAEREASELKHCEVSLHENAALILFDVICFRDGKEDCRGVVQQDKLGITVRRWTYMNVDPFDKSERR